jgi:arylsulfatase A-like enzyme
VNIILLVVDTLRYDHVGANGNDWIKTPNFDRLAAKSWVFDRAYCNSFPTIPHRTDVMYGQYANPFHPWKPLAYDIPTLPRTLADAGYATQLIHDTPHLVNGGHSFDSPFACWTFIRGAEVDRAWMTDPEPVMLSNWKFDPVWDCRSRDSFEKPAGKLMLSSYARNNRNRRRLEDWNAARLFSTASEFVADNQNRDNFFLWVDCFDPHEPWDVPPEFAKMYVDDPNYDGSIDPRAFCGGGQITPEAGKRLAAWYAGKVSWVDHCFGEMLDKLEETGLMETTALVVTADHGTNVGERNLRFGKSCPVCEQEAHVPMMVYAPGQGNGRCDAVVQPQDIFATVARLAGVELPAAVTQSQDMLEIAKGRPSQSKVAVAGEASCNRPFTVFSDEHYLHVSSGGGDDVLYRNGELWPIDSPDPALVAKLRADGIAELERRGVAAEFIEWFRMGGERPESWERGVILPGWNRYWENNYRQW